MGCGSSRSPARVGVFLEDDEAFYPELYPPLVNSWVGDTSQEARSSFCESSSPPPYTPLPLSGHITLLLGIDSPTKPEEHSVRSPDNFREGSASPAPAYTTSSSTQQLQPDTYTNNSQTDTTEFPVGNTNDLSTSSQSTTHVIDVINHGDMRHPTSSPNQHISLSSSFPSARPPSPFPRARSLSSQLPPLRQLRHFTGEQPPLIAPHNAAFRLPPLALQRQHSLDSSATSNSSHHHHKRRRRRVRSVSCQMQTTGLDSVQEQTIAIVQ